MALSLCPHFIRSWMWRSRMPFLAMTEGPAVDIVQNPTPHALCFMPERTRSTIDGA